MKKVIAVTVLSFISMAAHSQIAKDFMIGGGFDLIKTDNIGFLGKAQLGTELNYFLDRKFTATGGFEWWTDENVSAVIGGRWYPIDELFVRARGLIGVNDLSLGAGWSRPITENLHFEAMGDFYFRVDFSVRAGVAYVFRRKR